MPNYQKFTLVDGKCVWAVSRNEARTRWGDQLPWDIYLVGHGYSLTTYNRRNDDPDAPNPVQRTLQVPQGISVLFYCPEGGVFDSKLEAGVRGGHPQYEPIVVPVGNPENESEHMLVWPSLKTGFRLPEMVQLLKLGDPDNGPVQLQADIQDECGLYIGQKRMQGVPNNMQTLKRGNWAYLSPILTAIARAHTPTRVHWCGCRDDYPDTNMEFFEQALNPFGIERR